MLFIFQIKNKHHALWMPASADVSVKLLNRKGPRRLTKPGFASAQLHCLDPPWAGGGAQAGGLGVPAQLVTVRTPARVLWGTPPRGHAGPRRAEAVHTRGAQIALCRGRQQQQRSCTGTGSPGRWHGTAWHARAYPAIRTRSCSMSLLLRIPSPAPFLQYWGLNPGLSG